MSEYDPSSTGHDDTGHATYGQGDYGHDDYGQQDYHSGMGQAGGMDQTGGDPHVITSDYGQHGTETTVDSDHDGFADEVYVQSGDGGPDAFYTHSFGSDHMLDTVSLDSHHDGQIDTVLADRNHDGRIDEVLHYGSDGRVDEADIDSNFDGRPDMEITSSQHDGILDTVHYDDPSHSPLAGTDHTTDHTATAHETSGLGTNPYASN
jgi:hypothetical protein